MKDHFRNVSQPKNANGEKKYNNGSSLNFEVGALHLTSDVIYGIIYVKNFITTYRLAGVEGLTKFLNEVLSGLKPFFIGDFVPI